MRNKNLIPNLFRSEYSKIATVICKSFGLANIQLAEDLVSETFLSATETWGLKGIPENPTAWLYTVAKNKAKDYFKRENIYKNKIRPELQQSANIPDEINLDWSKDSIQDSQLQMLFAVCNPILSSEEQIALALRILCGFGNDEIAQAFLSNKSTINKRLVRAKDKLRKNNVDLSFPPEKELQERLHRVLSVLYLLFNEGYYSANPKHIIRKELCLESMRLLYMLLQNSITNLPEANALMALFCFHTSRFDTRIGCSSEIILYADQDETKWDIELIEKGNHYLNLSGQGEEVTKYHLEAMIAYWHTQKKDSIMKWESILQLYNQLLQINYSPIIALNRTYALAKANSYEIAISAALKIDLKDNLSYHALLAELYSKSDKSKQLKHLEITLTLTKSESNKLLIQAKILENKS